MLIDMTSLDILLEEIDFENETYRISENLNSTSMLASLQEIGQVNPVLLLESRDSRKTIICGFRRLRALRKLGRRSAISRILVADQYSPLQAFGLALWDNLSHRQINPLEKARVISALTTIFGVDQETVVQTYLPILGLPAQKKILRDYLSLHSVHSDLRRLFIEGRLTLSSITCLAGMSHEARHQFASLIGKIRLSASRQREALDLIQELAVVTNTRQGEILQQPEVLAVLNDARLSPFQKGEKICKLLYRWRNPHISLAAERFLAKKKQLGLPVSIRITPEPFFETSRLHIEFDVSSPQDFRDVANALQKAAQVSLLENLFQTS